MVIKEIKCTGTLGDTYINLCKMYNLAQHESILCKHYTKHNNWYQLIREIYGLCPNIMVKFLKKLPHRSIVSHFSEKDRMKLNIEYFPSFEQFQKLRKKFKLPLNYICMSIKSGRSDQKRLIDEEQIRKIIKTNKNIVIVGVGVEMPKGYNYKYDLIGKTNLLEAMAIVAGSYKFYGFQGLFCYVALSQKISTTIYIKHPISDLKAFWNRCPNQWQKYIVNIIKI